MKRHYSFFDKLCLQFDQSLKVLSGEVIPTGRVNPATVVEEGDLDAQQAEQAAALMRVNHVGEVCAQALYQGQALTARNETVRIEMQQAAQEENDHLLWCAQRLTELHSRPSYLNPLWYTGSFMLGAVAGLAGDRWSLGFVVETERQVEAHLASHLQQLPEPDYKSRAIVAQMKIDEAKHAATAQANGAKNLPQWVRVLMRTKAKIMTITAYWI